MAVQGRLVPYEEVLEARKKGRVAVSGGRSRRRVGDRIAWRPTDPEYDEFNIFNPADWEWLRWLGIGDGHSETSMFKGEAQNRAIMDAVLAGDLEQAGLSGRDGDRERYMERMEEDRGRILDLIDEYNTERKALAREVRPQIESDRAFWNQMRDQALSDWQTDKGGILDFWGGTRDTQSALLQDLQKQQMGLARELRQAPSTVQEQARLVADANLAQNVALAGAMGGGVSSNYANLGNFARTQQGNLLTQTSALRAAEYADRINQQSSLLGQAGNLSGALIGLGATDANLRTGIAQKNYDILTGLGTQNVNIGTALQGRQQSLLGNILGGSGLASSMLSYDLGMRQQDWAEKTGMYNMMRGNRANERQLLEDSWKRSMSFFSTLANIFGGEKAGEALQKGFGDSAATGQTENPMQIGPFSNPQKNMFSQSPYIPIA